MPIRSPVPALFVCERVFQTRGVCRQAFPSFPPPPHSFHLFLFTPFCVWPKCEKTPLIPLIAQPEFRSLHMGMLAMQAKYVQTFGLYSKSKNLPCHIDLNILSFHVT